MRAALGIVANPMSGRDIRRLVAQASVFPNAEKANMALRIIAAAGALGVGRVLMSTDTFGLAAAVRRGIGRRDVAGPLVEFCELTPATGTADDTRALVRRMRAAGVDVIVLLGGDGTVRAAAADVGDTPVVALSTGTNNVFPQTWEATVAGCAAGLVATGRVAAAAVTDRAKLLRVTCGTRTEIAVVDVCVGTTVHTGAKAVWQVATLRELYCAFAEPHAIGLSSIAGQLRPVSRYHPGGVAVSLGGGTRTVLAPVAPGMLAPVGVREVSDLAIGECRRSMVPAGTVAVDGEREIEFGPADPVTVTLTADGPYVVDIARTLRLAAAHGLLTGTTTEEVQDDRNPLHRRHAAHT
jgi:predicted polyphosphate/ATP-dependent NAD kinase